MVDLGRLTGLSLTIWIEVVVGGEHLELRRGTQPLAVVVPVEDYYRMKGEAEAHLNAATGEPSERP